jgi:phosphoenolpyruvate carboxylase
MCRIDDEAELSEILHLVYQSLWDVGSGMIADGHLLDILRRVHTFGLSLLKMDLRQESTRHTDLLAAITTELELGDYKAWDEEKKCAWLVWPLCACVHVCKPRECKQLHGTCCLHKVRLGRRTLHIHALASHF